MHPEPLSRLLLRFRPSDAREEQFAARMHTLLTQPEPFSRDSYDPGHFTASAFVLSPMRDCVLLIFHRKLQLWLQPGGHIEPGDANIELAARREVEEEVGLGNLTLFGSEQIFDIDIHAIPARKAAPRHEHFDVRFAFVAASLAVRPNAEVAEPRWVELGEVERVTTDRSVIRAVEKLQKLCPS